MAEFVCWCCKADSLEPQLMASTLFSAQIYASRLYCKFKHQLNLNLGKILKKWIMCDEYFKKVCRACLKPHEEELFDWNTEGFVNMYNYAQCFQEVTQLSLTQDLPQMLCYDCAYELRITYAFIKRAHKIDRKLRSCIEKSLKKMPSSSTQEKPAFFEPKVSLDEIAQYSPACCEAVETEDLFGEFVSEAIIDPFNDLEQESSANTTPIEESIDLGSHEAVLVLIPPETTPSLSDEEENQLETAITECGAEPSVGNKIDPSLCGDMLEDTKIETAIDWTSDVEFLKEDTPNDEDITDGVLIPPEISENSSQSAPVSTQQGIPSRNHVCKTCGVALSSKYNLYRHQFSIHNLNTKPPRVPRRKLIPQQCEICKEMFPYKAKLNHHMKVKHGASPWLCHVCPRIFNCRSTLERHTRTHENRERKFVCELCGIKCLTPGILRGHMQVHEKDRKAKYACDECDKTFYARSGLVLHKRHHTGDTVGCKVCGRAFPRPVDLKVHMRSHTKERPYQCDICPLSFASVTVFKNHKFQHEGVKFKCDVCDKVYTNKRSLISHKRLHDAPSLQCQVCEKLFRSKHKLTRHIKAVHRISTSEEAEEFVIRLKTEKKFSGRRYGVFTEQ